MKIPQNTKWMFASFPHESMNLKPFSWRLCRLNLCLGNSYNLLSNKANKVSIIVAIYVSHSMQSQFYYTLTCLQLELT